MMLYMYCHVPLTTLVRTKKNKTNFVAFGEGFVNSCFL